MRGLAGDRGGGPETRRHADLHDTGRRAAEFRWTPREYLRDDPRGGAVLQRAGPGQPGKPGLDDRFRLRCLHRHPRAGRRRPDLRLYDTRRRQIRGRLDPDRRRRGGQLEQDRRAAGRHHQRAPRLLFDDRQDRGARPEHGRLPSQIRDGRVPAGARRPLCLHLQKGNPRPRPALVREEHHGVRPVPL